MCGEGHTPGIHVLHLWAFHNTSTHTLGPRAIFCCIPALRRSLTCDILLRRRASRSTPVSFSARCSNNVLFHLLRFILDITTWKTRLEPCNRLTHPAQEGG